MDNSELNGIKNDTIRALLTTIKDLHPGAPASLATAPPLEQGICYLCFIESEIWPEKDFVMVFRWDDGNRYTLRLRLNTPTISGLVTACKKALNSHKSENYIFPHPTSGA